MNLKARRTILQRDQGVFAGAQSGASILDRHDIDLVFREVNARFHVRCQLNKMILHLINLLLQTSSQSPGRQADLGALFTAGHGEDALGLSQINATV